MFSNTENTYRNFTCICLIVKDNKSPLYSHILKRSIVLKLAKDIIRRIGMNRNKYWPNVAYEHLHELDKAR